MCGFDSDVFPECKSISISGGFIHQAGIFGVKCFSIFCGLILADFKSGEILMPNDLIAKYCYQPAGHIVTGDFDLKIITDSRIWSIT